MYVCEFGWFCRMMFFKDCMTVRECGCERLICGINPFGSSSEIRILDCGFATWTQPIVNFNSVELSFKLWTQWDFSLVALPYNINNLLSTCDDGGCSELVCEFEWWSRAIYFDSWKAELISFSLLAPLGMPKCQKWVWPHWTESHRMVFVCSNLHTIYLPSMHREFLKILTEHGRCVVCNVNKLYTKSHVELEDINSRVLLHGVINLGRIWRRHWVVHVCG